MAVPVLLPTVARDESFGGVTYHIEGELVPALHVELSAMPIYFEHHILLWKDPIVNISLKALQGAFKRILSGMQVFMTQAHGPGRIAFSRDGAGHVFALLHRHVLLPRPTGHPLAARLRKRLRGDAASGRAD